MSTENLGPEKFLTAVLDQMVVGDEMGLRRWIVGWVGTAELAPGECRVECADGQAALVVNIDDPAGSVLVSAVRGGVEMQMRLDAVEARAYVLAANATATALRFVQDVFRDVSSELDRQHSLLLAGVEPQHPASMDAGGASEFDAEGMHPESYQRGYDAALEQIRSGNENCPHAGLPPAGSVEPFGFRSCPVCGQRMRAYPTSVTQDGPEWRPAL